MFGEKRPTLFEKIVPVIPKNGENKEDIEAKIEEAFARIKKRALERKKRKKRGNAKWNPGLNDKVLVKRQNQSGAIRGETFVLLYEGPYFVNRVLSHSVYELVDGCGNIRGEFNKQQLKPYRTHEDSDCQKSGNSEGQAAPDKHKGAEGKREKN
jgi:hypothetical protein